MKIIVAGATGQLGPMVITHLRAKVPPRRSSSEALAVQGALFDDSRQLSVLLGRPTTPLSASVTDALRRMA